MDVQMINLYTGYLYRPQTKLRKGNVFTSVCQEFCPQGGLPQCMLGYTPLGGQTPQRQTPHAGIHPGQAPPGGSPPWADPPSRRLLQRTVHILLECILVAFVRKIYVEPLHFRDIIKFWKLVIHLGQ